MRRFHLHLASLSLVLVLVATACVPDVIEPAKPGEVTLYLEVPNQRLEIDRSGAHVQASEVRLSLSTPVLDGAGAICLEGACAGGSRVVTLHAGEQLRWAMWRLPEGSSATLRLALVPTTSREMMGGATLLVAGIYNLVLAEPDQNYGHFVLGLAHEQTITADIPPSTSGSRLRLRLDPGVWLYDRDRDRVLDLEELVGKVSTSANGAAARELIQRVQGSLLLQTF
ncbi:MAG TPA: hypothetical protein VF178_12270 [Gemmatimonadaceae bacterium]